MNYYYTFFSQELKQPSDNRIHVLAAAFKEGYSIERLYELTKIDKWFLSRMKCIMDYALMLKSYREKAEVMMMFSYIFFQSKIILTYMLKAPCHILENTLGQIHLTNQNMKDKKVSATAKFPKVTAPSGSYSCEYKGLLMQL